MSQLQCFVCSAFDTLAKVFNPSEEGIEQRLADKTLRCVGGATIQLIGRDQETPIIEVEGPLLTDSHVGFKVSGVISAAEGLTGMQNSEIF